MLEITAAFSPLLVSPDTIPQFCESHELEKALTANLVEDSEPVESQLPLLFTLDMNFLGGRMSISLL